MGEIPIDVIANYYDKNQVLYNALWSSNALHYGFWDVTTKTHRQSLDNTDIVIASSLNISPGDNLLDAGCGVGGTALYIAKNFGVKVKGITISEVQVKQATRALKKSSLEHLVSFERKDFTNTGYKSNSFDKIYAITSCCQANSKPAFVSEMNRLLKSGGKFLVSDAFLGIVKNEQDTKMLETFLRGWAIPHLVKQEKFREVLLSAGFCNIQCEEQSDRIKKSCLISWKLGIFFYPFSWIGSVLGIIPKNMHPHCVACIVQKHLFDNGVLKYYTFIAEKN